MDISNIDDVREKLKILVIDLERDLAGELLETLVSKSDYREVISTYLEPVLSDIGEMWSREKISLAQGYVAGKIAEDILENAMVSGDYCTSTININRPVVIGNIEDDYHAFGRKMVSTFLRIAGWKVYDLGNDVTAEEFIEKAKEVDACIIGVSAMMYTTAENIKKVRKAIDDNNLKNRVKLAVGGAVFKLRPELVAEVGGDGTADSAINAPELFDELYLELKQSYQNE